MPGDGKGSSWRHCRTRGFVYFQYGNALSIVFISIIEVAMHRHVWLLTKRLHLHNYILCQSQVELCSVLFILVRYEVVRVFFLNDTTTYPRVVVADLVEDTILEVDKLTFHQDMEVVLPTSSITKTASDRPLIFL